MRPFRSLLPAAALLLALPAFAADTYVIDAVHSEVGFKIRHLVAKTSGRFTKFKGSVVVDEQKLANSSVDVTIDAASISTDNEGRDKHLRSADFFDVEKFPAITFKSVKVEDKGQGRLDVTGDLTMHGVTRRVVLPVTSLGATKGMKPGSVVAGFEAALKLNRNDFGIKAYPNVLGDDVDISLSIEAEKQDAAKK